MSCNGCRVLRKRCSETCALRPCLQWIESPQSQSYATVFVAKFFGRAGLMEFINAVPSTERPGLFQSLLYEACGRTVNPVYGAVGLLSSGKWQLCEEAVDKVLNGQIPFPLSTSTPTGCPFRNLSTLSAQQCITPQIPQSPDLPYNSNAAPSQSGSNQYLRTKRDLDELYKPGDLYDSCLRPSEILEHRRSCTGMRRRHTDSTNDTTFPTILGASDPALPRASNNLGNADSTQSACATQMRRRPTNRQVDYVSDCKDLPFITEHILSEKENLELNLSPASTHLPILRFGGTTRKECTVDVPYSPSTMSFNSEGSVITDRADFSISSSAYHLRSTSYTQSEYKLLELLL